MNIVLFSETEITEPLAFSDERAVHIRSVLRKSEGDCFEAGIIGGMAGTARITKIEAQKIFFTWTPLSDGKPLHPVKVLIGFPRPIQLKRIFRDMAGLGVAEIYLFGTELGEKSYMQSKIFERGAVDALLRDGSAQAKSTHVPQIFLFATLAQCLESLDPQADISHNAPPAIRAALDNVDADTTLMRVLKKNSAAPQTVFAAIGSERGWTDNERALFRKSGWTLCRMGDRILRTETAACTAVSLILSAMNIL